MKPQNAVCILRVSTKKQLDGEGIENQRQDVIPYCERKGYTVLREFVLAETASDGDKRDDFDSVLDYCMKQQEEIAAVVIWKVDRFSRGGLNDYYQLKAYLASHGIRLESATEHIDGSASGEVMEGMLALFARYDNRTRVARTIGAEKIMTREGYWCRPAPTGFINDKIVVGMGQDGKPMKRPTLKRTPDEHQWELLRYGLRKQLTGVYKISDVAKELRDKGFHSREMIRNGVKRSTPLSVQTWTKICRSPVYGGMNCGVWTDGQIIRGKWDGAITPEEWYELQRVLNGDVPEPVKVKHLRQNPDLPLRRFLRCPHCHSPVRGAPSVGKSGKKFLYYDCKNKDCRFRVQAIDAHTLFQTNLNKITPTDGLLSLFREIVLEAWDEKWKSLNRESIQKAKQATALKEERQSIMGLMKKSYQNPELLAALQKDYERVNKEYTLATMQRNKTEIESCDAETVVRYCEYFLKNAYELWDCAPVDRQYRYQSLPYPNGIAYDELQGLRTPDISPVYTTIEALKHNDLRLAAPRGIEPRFPG